MPKTIAEMREEAIIPVVIIDHHGIVTFVNPPFEAAFGWSQEELIGQPVTTIIPKEFRDAHNMGFSRFLSTGQPTLLGQPLELNISTRDGTDVAAEHFMIAERHQDEWIMGATIKTLTN
ncbi:MAG: PAS domain S-box protein [Gammaproteobacteria bacterium]|nr:PAS domain S-box protein [Gammaproteobacteria bacterium]